MNTDVDPFFLINLIGDDMLTRLEWLTLQPKVIVDWRGSAKLEKRFAEAKITTGDESVTLMDHSVDLIFANLVLPWCKDIKKILLEWRRLLRPEGVLLLSSLGPDTLKELQNSTTILPHLVDMHDIGDALTQARFADPVLDAEMLTVTYRELPKLLNELQMMKMIENEFPLQPQGDIYSLTFEIIYGHAFGPNLMVDHVADEEGVVRVPLAHLRRRK